MTTTYSTREGDSVDFIAWRFYKSTDAAAVLQVLQANPGLADHGPALPAGVDVVLPELDATTETAGVRLWD